MIMPAKIRYDVGDTFVITKGLDGCLFGFSMNEWNNFEDLERIVAENEGEIAAFISTPYMHGNFVDNILPARPFPLLPISDIVA